MMFVMAALPPAATPAPAASPLVSVVPAEAVAEAAAAALAWDRIDCAITELIVVVRTDDAPALSVAAAVVVAAEASVELACTALSVAVACTALSVLVAAAVSDITADVAVATAESVMTAELTDTVEVLELSVVLVELESEDPELFELEELVPSHAAPVSERPARMSDSESMKIIAGPASTELVPFARCTTSFGSVLSSHVMKIAAGPFSPSGIWQLSIDIDSDWDAPPTSTWQNSC